MKYRTIVADPPWRYSQPATTKADARNHYPLLSLDEICALPVPHLAEADAHLWLWTTNAMLADGQATVVLRAWGFDPLTIVTWCKKQPGVGHYLRNNRWPRGTSGLGRRIRASPKRSSISSKLRTLAVDSQVLEVRTGSQRRRRTCSVRTPTYDDS